MSDLPLHMQSSTRWGNPEPRRSNPELAKTMSMTLDDDPKRRPRPKVATWRERRAKYKPNTDASSLGFGPSHRHYQRYLSSFVPGTSSTNECDYAEQARREYNDYPQHRSSTSPLQLHTDAYAGT